jgi:hypothetical protein
MVEGTSQLQVVSDLTSYVTQADKIYYCVCGNQGYRSIKAISIYRVHRSI